MLIEQVALRGAHVIWRPRPEARVFALPPKEVAGDILIDVFGNKLRLYYVLLSAEVIVLLGGGIAHEGISGDVPPQFWDAQTFAKKINEAKGIAYSITGNVLESTSKKGDIIIF